jgi:hypothetical protein
MSVIETSTRIQQGVTYLRVRGHYTSLHFSDFENNDIIFSKEEKSNVRFL